MSDNAREPSQPLYTQIDVSHSSIGREPQPGDQMLTLQQEQVRLLRELVSGQDRQNQLLEELVAAMSGAQRQRAAELGQWKQANPQLAQSCRHAAEALGRVQTEFLASLTEEVSDSFDGLVDGEFMFNEFVDRFGPRMAHLNGILQVLSQLAAGQGVPPVNPK